jgi:hypothetical protein
MAFVGPHGEGLWRNVEANEGLLLTHPKGATPGSSSLPGHKATVEGKLQADARAKAMATLAPLIPGPGY